MWSVARAIADGWDTIELWLTQLPFPFQVALALVVGVPLCWVAAAGIDGAVDRLLAVAGRRRS